MYFSFVSDNPDCGIVLYNSATGGERRIPFSENKRLGNVYREEVKDLQPEETSYLFYKGEQLVPDEHGLVFPGMSVYGKSRSVKELRAGTKVPEFDWEGDCCPGLPYNQILLYCMHVRGFTKHVSSGVKARGTFAGITEKIPYLKEIGVTTLELQPCYEFQEVSDLSEKKQTPAYKGDGGRLQSEKKLNYWGYKKGFYYAPKAAYASSGNPVGEMKSLVKELHRNGMELVMQFYFPKEVNRNEISEILRFWAREYHIDGFHLMGENIPTGLLAGDQLLADRKLLFYHFSPQEIDSLDGFAEYPHLGEYNDGFMYDMRRFLKGDENTLDKALQNMRYLPEKTGAVHYLTNYYGMTLADLVSYDHKHNEINGENNHDGNDYNGSWNCGEEGITRSKKIKKLRVKQIKNAMCLILLSQSTPLIFMGDEFGNSQKGNNNPWCQDNSLTWLDWSLTEKNQELLAFWKTLVEFRKKHEILHPSKAMKLMDTLSCGYPDLSYHGESAWRSRPESYQRHMGIMLCESYGENEKLTDTGKNGFVYIAVNMHWESHKLAFPRLPKGFHWKLILDTAKAQEKEQGKEEGNNSIPGKATVSEDVKENMREMAPRSIAVLISEKEPGNNDKKKNGKALSRKSING